MKSLLVFILVATSLVASSQDCNLLDSVRSFKGIKFGKPIPNNIKNRCMKLPKSSNDTLFVLVADSVLNNPSLFKYTSFKEQFESIDFGTLKNGDIYSVTLTQEAKGRDTVAINAKEDPPFITSVHHELVRLFGNESEAKLGKTQGMGNYYRFKWICNNIEVSLTFLISIQNLFFLEIKDKELEKMKSLEEYQ